MAKAQRIHICRQFEITVYFWLDVCNVELFSPAYLSSCVQHTQLMRVLSFLNINWKKERKKCEINEDIKSWNWTEET